ncbi:hypothetical protein AAFF_G00061460 [Aldrovandia affinis]|uniref:Uncharacterized protein n=1 Tax=Aldrovandia affinis TaxID=143900 RepID=A0AAD7RZW0_9TELE|nr:hypothetical protein AAFF_G00061460 [Aldrovandia affinis]
MFGSTSTTTTKVLKLGPEFILIPFVGVTLFGLLASLGAYIRRLRTDVVWRRLRPQGGSGSSECDSDREDEDEDEDLTEPLWVREEEFREGSLSAGLSSC